MRTPLLRLKSLYSDAPMRLGKWISEPSLSNTRNSARVRVMVNYRERETSGHKERERENSASTNPPKLT